MCFELRICPPRENVQDECEKVARFDFFFFFFDFFHDWFSICLFFVSEKNCSLIDIIMVDYYRTLGLPRNASDAEIKKAWVSCELMARGSCDVLINVIILVLDIESWLWSGILIKILIILTKLIVDSKKYPKRMKFCLTVSKWKLFLSDEIIVL